MARTAQMRLMELMVLKQDSAPVIEYIGKKESFQFQSKAGEVTGSAGTGLGKSSGKDFDVD